MTEATARRAADLARLVDEPWDLLVVGGGITGAGALLDAVSRGMRVALVEQDDIASGTSSRSSRLIHGGLRYLQQGRVGLVREALSERARLLELAPHLVRLEGFAFPVYGTRFVRRAFYEAGLTAYDLLGASRDGGRHRFLGVDETLAYAPALVRDGLRGSLLYHDAMEDDARFALAVVRTALAHADGGAVAVTRVRVTSPLLEGDRVAGARLVDVVDGSALEVRASAVLDATGAWGSLRDSPLGGAGSFEVVPARGSHLVVERSWIPARGGMTLRLPGRNVFLVPWPRHWIVGTTDRPYRGPVDHVAADADEVDEILGSLNEAMDLDLARDDVTGTYAGLRPLVGPSDAASTLTVSREHRVATDRPGLVRISGGKYTTYRLMARDAVDAVLGPAARDRPSRTAQLPIDGAAPRSTLDGLAAALVRDAGRSMDQATSLVDRHGTRAPEVLELGRSRDLLRPLVDGHPYLEAEVAWAVDHELAWSLDDVLARRFRLAPALPDRGASIAARVAAIAGESLAWDEPRQAGEVEAYLRGARREYGVPGVRGE